MIKKIKINNYQSHKNTTIQFTPGLNCIVASSDVGKSALIRALRWTLFNNTYFKTITWGQKESKVELDLYNGNKIIREKGNKNLNRYTIIKDGQETIFNNFGDYPTLVGEVAKFNKLIIDYKKEYNLNVLSQHDNLFFIKCF